MIDFILWLILGAVAGWLAGMVMGGRGFGIIGNIVVGIVGAFIGGFIGRSFFGVDASGFSLTSLVVAFIGAIIFLFILRLIPGRQPLER